MAALVNNQHIAGSRIIAKNLFNLVFKDTNVLLFVKIITLNFKLSLISMNYTFSKDVQSIREHIILFQ